MATGAQRQHFTVFSALGISMSYNSVITRPTAKPQPRKNVNLDVTAVANTKKLRPPAPGTLYLLSEACRASARKIASSHLFITVYDNINMTIKVAEQILGRKSKRTLSYYWKRALRLLQMHKKTVHAPPLFLFITPFSSTLRPSIWMMAS